MWNLLEVVASVSDVVGGRKSRSSVVCLVFFEIVGQPIGVQ